MKSNRKSWMMRSALLLALMLGMQSCCEPEFKDSFPQVLYDTYRLDTVVKDRLPPGEKVTVLDSGYYPVYEFQVKNSGLDEDIFTMTIEKNGFGFDITDTLAGGEIATFRTPGPLSDTAAIPAQWYYFSFFRQDPDDLEIQELAPRISFKYGEIFKGDEACNTAPSYLDVDPRLFR